MNSGKDSALWISDRLGPLSCSSNTQIVFEVSVLYSTYFLIILGTDVTINLV